MDITERLQLFMQHEGVTAFQMNKEAGLTRTLLIKAIEKHQGLNTATIEKIVRRYPNLNADWLITGRGNMLIDAEAPKLSKVKTQVLPKELESSLYRQIVWHLLLQESYTETHDRLVEIIETLNTLSDKASTLSEQLSRIRQVMEAQYAIQAQDHGLYEMTLRIAAGEDGKFTPSQLKNKEEMNQRILRYLGRK
ncbi:MAG: hypothetical protein U0L19_03540 [Bacteroidales bacterium]|nr:hypothetical protein [Bacteroidales bacterium]